MLRLPFPFIAVNIENRLDEDDESSIVRLGAIQVGMNLDIQDNFYIEIKPYEGGLDPIDAIERFEHFCHMIGQQPILGFWGNYEIILSLKNYYKKINRIWNFSPKTVDIKNIVIWEIARQEIPINPALGNDIQDFMEAVNYTPNDDLWGFNNDIINPILNAIQLLQYFRVTQNMPSVIQGTPEGSFVTENGMIPPPPVHYTRRNVGGLPRTWDPGVVAPFTQTTGNQLSQRLVNEFIQPTPSAITHFLSNPDIMVEDVGDNED